MCNCHQCSGSYEPPEAKGVYPCAFCRYEICEGDLYIETRNGKCCMHCANRLFQEELLLNEPVYEAEGG